MSLVRCLKLLFLFVLMGLSLSFAAFADGEYGPGFTGWHQADNGKWEYLESGSRAKNTWKTIDGKNCYFDGDGYWVENADPSGGNTAQNQTAAAQASSSSSNIAGDTAQSASSEALASGAVSAEYANRANPYPDKPDVVEVDIAHQHVFCYKGNVLMWDSYCVTGCPADGHSTPEGVFAIQSKERSRYLMGPVDPATGKNKWKNWVEYWMPFHDGCGLHDASWRSKFAGTIYQYAGSHGCVNLPVNKAPGLYELVYVGMPVVVHP